VLAWLRRRCWSGSVEAACRRRDGGAGSAETARSRRGDVRLALGSAWSFVPVRRDGMVGTAAPPAAGDFLFCRVVDVQFGRDSPGESLAGFCWW